MNNPPLRQSCGQAKLVQLKCCFATQSCEILDYKFRQDTIYGICSKMNVRTLSMCSSDLNQTLEGFMMRCSGSEWGEIHPRMQITQNQYLLCLSEQKPPAIDPSSTPGAQPLQTPLLVWIDDRPENNVCEVARARSMGVFVIELLSTSVAKAWVEANSGEALFLPWWSSNEANHLSTLNVTLLDFLNANDHLSRLRFISDNVRLESSQEAGSYINPTAGKYAFRRFTY